MLVPFALHTFGFLLDGLNIDRLLDLRMKTAGEVGCDRQDLDVHPLERVKHLKCRPDLGLVLRAHTFLQHSVC